MLAEKVVVDLMKLQNRTVKKYTPNQSIKKCNIRIFTTVTSGLSLEEVCGPEISKISYVYRAHPFRPLNSHAPPLF